MDGANSRGEGFRDAGTWRDTLIALFLSGAAFVTRQALQPLLGSDYPYLTFLLAVIYSAWRCRWPVSAAVLVLGWLMAHWFFIPPLHMIKLTAEASYGTATYLVSGAAVIAFGRRLRRQNARLQHELERRKEGEEALRRVAEFPEQNPSPVMRISAEGRLLYANPASKELLEHWNVATSGLVPESIRGRVDQITRDNCAREFEQEVGGRTFCFMAVPFPKAGYVNLYGSDATERKAAERALQEKHAELERAVQERTTQLQESIAELESFSYSIAHDMRAPLRAMRGFGKILVREAGGNLDPSHLEYLRRIMVSAQRLDALIQDVLNYSQMARADLPVESIDLDTLIQDILVSYPDFSPANAQIEIEGPLPPVLANRAALTQVISNLVGNAAKFVAPGVFPLIRISASQEGDIVKLAVRDNGIGIDEESQTRIFQMFQRLNRADLYEGTGIGLAIVRKAVERMGGSVSLKSEPGKGSTFIVALKSAKQ